MPLDRVDQRLEVINMLIEESFGLSEITADYDWAGVKVTLDNLIAFARLIRAEEIFFKTFYAMVDTRCSCRDAEGHLPMIFLSDGLNDFIREFLLPDLKYMLKVLKELVKKYKVLYNLEGKF